jgi:hypothetical protein
MPYRLNGLIFLMLIRTITSWPRRRVLEDIRLRKSWFAHARDAPYAWIISPHVKHDSHRQLSNTTTSTVRVHIFSRGQISISFEGHAVMLYKPFSTCTGLPRTRSCVWMDLRQWCYLRESNADTYEEPQLQELLSQFWLTGFWMTYKDRA